MCKINTRTFFLRSNSSISSCLASLPGSSTSIASSEQNSIMFKPHRVSKKGCSRALAITLWNFNQFSKLLHCWIKNWTGNKTCCTFGMALNNALLIVQLTNGACVLELACGPRGDILSSCINNFKPWCFTIFILPYFVTNVELSVSQGNAATNLTVGGKNCTSFVDNSILYTTVKEFRKSVKNWQRYSQSSAAPFWDTDSFGARYSIPPGGGVEGGGRG